jgi:hypothetical protein
MKNTPEFIDTYSDDLLYLMDFRDSHLTHPGKVVIDFLFQASISRIFCVFMVGNIEAMLENWKEKDTNNILAPYFNKSSNEDRIKALTNNFKTNNINVDNNVLKQYLAIKYVRNTIIHSGWNENQKSFIEQQGFPIDTRNLKDEHLQLMYSVNIEMMKYIASTQINGLVELGSYAKLPNIKKYFTKKQLAGFLWNNLEKIHSLIYESKEITQEIKDEVIFDWNLYKEIALVDFIDFKKIDSSSKILRNLIDNKKYSAVPIGILNFENINLSELKNTEFLEGLVKVLNLNKTEIAPFITAYKTAKKCYERTKNITARDLLKIIAESNLSDENIKKESELAEKINTLGQLYYTYAEQQ